MNALRAMLMVWDSAVFLCVPLATGFALNADFEDRWSAQAPLTISLILGSVALLFEAGAYRLSRSQATRRELLQMLYGALAAATLTALVDGAVPAPSDDVVIQSMLTILGILPLLALPRAAVLLHGRHEDALRERLPAASHHPPSDEIPPPSP